MCNILESHFEILLHKSPLFIVHLALLCNFPLAHHCTINRGLLYSNTSLNILSGIFYDIAWYIINFSDLATLK